MLRMRAALTAGDDSLGSAVTGGIVDKSRYWLFYGGDSLRNVDAETIDIVATIELKQVWEDLGIFLSCSLCKQLVGSHCYHCDDCGKFQICPRCFGSQSCKDDLAESHQGHAIVHILYRPIAAPLYDGSDLDLLKKFADVQTEDAFYLYFPYFFHDVDGMDKFAQHNRAANIELFSRRPDRGTPLWNMLMDSLKFPTDWFVRVYGYGDWRSLHRSAMGLIVEKRIPAAAASKKLHQLLEKLKVYKNIKRKLYGVGNTEPTAWGRSAAHRLLDQAHVNPTYKEFVAYATPLQMGTELNKDLKQTKLLKALPSQSSIASQASVEAACPIRMLFALWKDEFVWQSLRVHAFVAQDQHPKTFILKPEWVGTIEFNMEVRKACLRIKYDDLPAVPTHGLGSLSKMPPRTLGEAGRQEILSPYQRVNAAQRLRMQGEYKAAADTLKALKDVPASMIAFQLQRVYEDQGYFNKESEWLSDVQGLEPLEPLDLSSDSGAPGRHAGVTTRSKTLWRVLVDLVLEYHQCFCKGRWLAAIESAGNVLNEYLRDWQADCESENVAMIYLEIYYHRILLATLRDQNMDYNPSAAISRLDAIRMELQRFGCVTEAWDVLQAQLEAAKVGYRSQYSDQEAAFSVTSYLHKNQVAFNLLDSFLSLEVFKGDSARRLEWAQAMLVLAEIQYDAGAASTAHDHQASANEVFLRESSIIGMLDAEVLGLANNGPISYEALSALYDRFRQHNDIGRLRKLRKLRPHCPEHENTGALEWLNQQRAAQAELAFEAGDVVAGHRWKLRKYSADVMSGNLIADSENTIVRINTPSSALLLTMASFNLANAYLTQGNYVDATTHAVLHHSLVEGGRDAELTQRALLLVVKTIEAAFASKCLKDQEQIFASLSEIWNGWLQSRTLQRWREGGGRCDEIERFIDGACFLPRLAGMMAKERIEYVQFEESIGCTALDHLKIAFDLFEAMPTYVSSELVPRLSMALGAVARYAGNPELACRSYHEGIQLCHTGDYMSLASLRFAAGENLTSLTSQDPEHWHHVLQAGRSLLKRAAQDYLKWSTFEGALIRCCAASLALLKSYVAEARGLKWHFERGVPAETQRILEPTEQAATERAELEWRRDRVNAMMKIRNLQQRAYELFNEVRYILYKIREDLRVSSRFEKIRNLRFLRSWKVANEIFDNACEIAWIGVHFYKEDLENPHSFDFLWRVVQARKAIILQEQTQSFQSARILKGIQNNPLAVELYHREQDLIEEGKHSAADVRLLDHRAAMEGIPELKHLLELRYPDGATFESLEPLVDVAKESFPADEHVVLIDWAQYRDYYFITGYDITQQTMLFGELLSTVDVKNTRDWVTKYLRSSEQETKDLLENETIFSTLHGLVEPISKHVRPGSLLVFSPAQILHAIPLHAIPLHDPDDFPVIYHHPVIYCPSAAILRNVVLHSLEPREDTFRACLHGRYSASHSAADSSIAATLQDLNTRLQDTGIDTTLATGDQVNYSTIETHLRKSHLFHFHGHADGKQLGQHLELDDASASNPTAGAAGRRPRTRQFRLQDAFTISIPAAVVLLIACGSGTQDIALNDDALGLVTAFFTAGATTVVGTLWPIDSADGLAFSQSFYEESFLKVGGKEGKGPRRLLNLARAQQRAVLRMRRSENTMCVDERARQQDPREPWRWAGYVLQGSWVCQAA